MGGITLNKWSKVRQEDILLQDLQPEGLKKCQIRWRSRWIHEAVWTLAWIPLHAQFHTCWYPPTKRWSWVIWRAESEHAKPWRSQKKLQPWSSSVQETSVHTCRRGDTLFYCMYSGWICIHGNHGDGARWVNTSSCLLVRLFQLFLFFSPLPSRINMWKKTIWSGSGQRRGQSSVCHPCTEDSPPHECKTLVHFTTREYRAPLAAARTWMMNRQEEWRLSEKLFILQIAFILLLGLSKLKINRNVLKQEGSRELLSLTCQCVDVISSMWHFSMLTPDSCLWASFSSRKTLTFVWVAEWVCVWRAVKVAFN